jgi:hypothetical protein
MLAKISRAADTHTVSGLIHACARRPVYWLNKALERGFATMCFNRETTAMTKQ